MHIVLYIGLPALQTNRRHVPKKTLPITPQCTSGTESGNNHPFSRYRTCRVRGHVSHERRRWPYAASRDCSSSFAARRSSGRHSVPVSIDRSLRWPRRSRARFSLRCVPPARREPYRCAHATTNADHHLREAQPHGSKCVLPNEAISPRTAPNQRPGQQLPPTGRDGVPP